jgi:minor fimbrial subunit
LYGNIVDFTCVAEGSDSDKTVTLGTWPTKQLSTAGSRTQPVPFTLKLTGCPPGSASITFSGKAEGSDNSLLALNDASAARNVAVEIRDRDKTRLALQQASQAVAVDAGEMQSCHFMLIILPRQITRSQVEPMRMLLL